MAQDSVPKRAKKARRNDPDGVIMQAGAQFWKIGSVNIELFVYFDAPSRFIKKSATKTLKIDEF